MASFAATVQVNPEGASPLLTEDQVWRGLQFKGRNPKEFVPMITSSEVLQDTDEGSKYTRKVSFGGSPSISETVQEYEPSMVYFEMETGTRVSNVLSYNEKDELLLTFTFSNGIPGVQGERPPSKELNGKIGAAVAHSVEVIRKMVKEGKL